MFANSSGRPEGSHPARYAIEQSVAGVPNLLSETRIQKFLHTEATIDHSQEAVASQLGSVLPELLRQRGFVIVQMPVVERDEAGCPSVRVLLSDRPWADGEVYADHAGHLVWTTVPARVLLQDVPAVAAALLAVHDITRRSR
ncbi:hypothetical protein FZI85_27680 [Mycobacterium sp. CBMA293]|uniref:Uncharacterized protein n=1 Tax=Mycolicibacterium sp. CBMA 213 TaxID=1968788 RepID=A0A1S6GKT0_9MYCO|nr:MULTISPECIES: hypothetical protein [unclassified Mycolicibacterium]AQS22475.1 hypothetical protein pCBMA213_2_00111 [Mycolicibacterium sp. CBMA 213]MUL48375.1 hypothetical protein [Mycolicibacterium sp. CBMA 360]MUL62387.1 hypothetical protein [Mycolicibacterium sp. CBMA 335]MUM04524.1 hypothetical protein [Mycolicibacterium sp. CBMA 213]MUM14787.1 hypothetical protein [Mycolicibacterium sp. CBMA 293]